MLSIEMYLLDAPVKDALKDPYAQIPLKLNVGNKYDLLK